MMQSGQKIRRWKSRKKLTTVSAPASLAPALKALSLLLDEGDAELLDFLESRFIELPQN